MSEISIIEISVSQISFEWYRIRNTCLRLIFLRPRVRWDLILRHAYLFLACEQQTHFRSSLLSLLFSEGEKRRPEMRLLSVCRLIYFLNERFGKHHRSISNHQQLTDPTPVSLHFNQAGHSINDVILVPLELIRSNRDAVRNGLISSPLIWYPLVSKTNNNPSLLLSHFQILIWNELLALFSFFF